ncbi:MAG: 6-hydroxymethylpterin diphosphokinase MptE-like protein [Desulfovibrio sp.]
MSTSKPAAVSLKVLEQTGNLLSAAPYAHIEEEGLLRASGEIRPREFSHHIPAWRHSDPKSADAYGPNGPKVFEFLPEGTTTAQLSGHTKLCIFIGAQLDDQFNAAYEQQELAIVVFEPDPEKVVEFVEAAGHTALAARGVIIISGAPDSFEEPLSKLLPATLFNFGYPVFFPLEGFKADDGGYTGYVVETMELLYYRYRMYCLEAQALGCSIPLRDITHGFNYDQQYHTYENVGAYTRYADISCLHNSFRGNTAILVAAGKAMQDKISYIKANADKAVVICVNGALKALLAAGIEPHFCIINDTSLLSARSLKDLPPKMKTVLVAHSMSSLGLHTPGQQISADNGFSDTFLFGTHLPEIFGQRPMLRLHGSVISTAYSFARHLGCTKALFVGVQLCSNVEWTLDYVQDSEGATHNNYTEEIKSDPDYFPLYPVRSITDDAYTSLNFLDAARWLTDEIRTGGIECINTTAPTILQKPSIFRDSETFALKENSELLLESEPELTDTDINTLFSKIFHHDTPQVEKRKVCSYLAQEKQKWSNTAGPVRAILAMEGELFFANAENALKQLDSAGVTYMVQRYNDFNNRHFHSLYFDGDNPQMQEEGLRYYLQHVAEMAESFLTLLDNISIDSLN